MSIEPSKVNSVIEVSLGWVDVIAIFSGAASLVMAGLAIWLSITFYKMSDVSAKEMKDSTNKINSNVEKLEKMFDTMYADTFTMVKETVTHMRKQVDRNTDVNEQSHEINKQIDDLVTEQVKKLAFDNISREELKDSFMDLLKESKEIEFNVIKQDMKEKVLDILGEGDVSFKQLEEALFTNSFKEEQFELFFEAVHELQKDGFIDANFTFEPEGFWAVSTNKPIKLLKKKH
ncbi:hypothetical protein [Lysinibacillus sp. JNUCC-52]|uniref:hypothetical protein n=1 Tax=Lysinibacillus sp. JNUCC-52 TaxID=2792480 RepID=UPI001934B9DF|nr:hypothetical protein JNUCC52_02820 [Lysinibacillus sp. JNUCC-52]